MILRREEARDAAAVRRVNEAAFPTSSEAEMVARLTAADAVTLSLIAEVDHEVVGHILFSPVTIGEFQAVGLAPMAVLPSHQSRGIGSLLVRAGITELRKMGHEAVVVLGHARYYPRFGFVRASTFGIRWEHECRDESFLALELQLGALAGRGGIVRYRPEIG